MEWCCSSSAASICSPQPIRLRFRLFIWIPIAEQALGIAYATYGIIGAHTMTGQQLATQVSINVVVGLLFYLLRPSTTAGKAGELREASA